MPQLRRRWPLITLMIGLLTLVASLAFAQTAGFQVTSVTPGTIDPAQWQYAKITYSVPITADYRIYVTNGAGANIRGIVTYKGMPAGVRTTYWNGRDNYNHVVPNGAYTVVIEGYASGGGTLATGRGAVIVGSDATPPPPSGPQVITVTSVTNSTFDPSAGQTTTVNYAVPVTLATLTNTVVNSAGGTVRTLGTYPNVAAKSYIAPWNGKDSSGVIVAAGVYTIKLTGKDSAGATVAGQATVTVKIGTVTPPPATNAFAISSVNPAIIDPSAGQTTTVTYTVPTTADVTVSVRNSAGTTVRTISTTNGVAAGTRTVTWDGKDGSGAAVAAGTYSIVVSGNVTGATTAITTAAANVVVGSGTVTPPPPPPPVSGVEREFGYAVESRTAYNWEGWRYGSMSNKFGAAFTAQKTGTVTRLACEWKTQGSYGAGNYGYYDLNVVSSDIHGLPDTSKVLATQANFHPLNGGQPKDGWQIFDALDHSFQVTAGQRYWMVISPRTISSGNYSCPNTGSGHAIKFVDTQLYGMDGYVVADYGQQGAAWRGWISGDGAFPASWKSGASNTTSCTQRAAIAIFFSDGTAQGQAGYWGSGGSGSGYDRIYSGMSVGEQIYWNQPNATITKVGIFIGKVGTPTANLNWAIKNVSTGATLASGSIAPGSILSEGNQTYTTLSTPFALTRGQTYRISLSTTSPSSSAYRFFGACYDQGTATTDAIRYAAFTGASISQTTLQYSSDGSNWVNGGSGRSGYAFDMPFSLVGSYQ